MSSMTTREADALGGAPRPTSVYRYYDRHGVLIYVGITNQGIGRNRQHNDAAEWWPFVVRQEVEHLPSRPAAMAREKQLIRQHRPPFNRQHNLDHDDFRLAYLRWASVEAGADESPRDQITRLNRRMPLDLVEHTATRIVLRSRFEHRPLASLVRLAGRRMPIWLGDDNEKVGHIDCIEYRGPFTVLIGEPDRLLPGIGELQAHAALAWRERAKVAAADLRRVIIRSAEGPVVG